MFNISQNNGGYLNRPSTEIVEKVRENVILKNKDYEIVLTPENMKIEDNDDSKVPRILYENKRKKYCYQLDYNTFILIDRKDYKEYKDKFVIKDNRLLFLKSEEGKLGGRGSKLFVDGKICMQVYSNDEEYDKEYGEKDIKGEFKERGEEIKIYDDLYDYFRRTCRVYSNIKDFEKNIYSKYDDVYQYYLPEYMEARLEEYIDILNYCKKYLLKSKRNLEIYREIYNSYFDVNNEIYFDEFHNLKVQKKQNNLKIENKQKDVKDSTKQQKKEKKITIQKKIIVDFLKVGDLEKDDGIYVNGGKIISGAILGVINDIRALLHIAESLTKNKKEMEINFAKSPYYNSKEKPIIELKELEKKFVDLFTDIFELKDQFKEILEKFIVFFQDVMNLPIFLDSTSNDIKRLETIKDKILDNVKSIESEEFTKYFEWFDEYFNIYHGVDDIKIKKELDILTSYLKGLPNRLRKNLNSGLSFLKSNHGYLTNMGLKKEEVNDLYNEFRRRFYVENKLNIPENKNNLTDEEKKQLKIFISFMGKIIKELNKLASIVSSKVTPKNNLPDLKSAIDKLEEVMDIRISLVKENLKDIKSVLLTSLEKYLSLHKDLIMDRSFMDVDSKDIFEQEESCYRYRVKCRGNEFFSSVKPLIKEGLPDFFEQVKKYIGEDKFLYKNLYSLCDELHKGIKLNYAKGYYKDFDGLATVETIKNELKRYREYIENINKFNSKEEFLKKVDLLHEEVIPYVLSYEDLFEECKENEGVSLFKVEVFDKFKKMLIENVENVIKKIENLYKIENSNKLVVKNIKEKLSSIANKLSDIGDYDKSKNRYCDEIDEIVDMVDGEIKKLDELKKTEVEQEYIEKIERLIANLNNFKKDVESMKKEQWFLDRIINFVNGFRIEIGNVEALFNKKNAGDVAIKKLKEDLYILKYK